MGKIFYIMGKSSSGKDTIYRKLQESENLKLGRLVLYTTRPIRDGEKEGQEYHFVDEAKYFEFDKAEKVIEARTYQTVYGPWTYFTADDGSVDLRKTSYLAIGTLESYQNLKAYYGASALCPIYVEVEDGERLKRAIAREETQKAVIDHTRLSRVGAVLIVVDADAAVVRVILDQIILADAGSVELVLDESGQQVVRNL